MWRPRYKRWSRWLAVVAFLMISLVLAIARAEKPTELARPQGYVADFAGVLDQASVQRLANLGHELETRANARIEVVTVHSTDGEDIAEFATALEDKWKVGDAKLHRGALIILAIDDRKRRVEIGDGLEGVLPDAKVGDLSRAATPQLQAGQYGAAAFTIESGMAVAIAQDAGVTLDPAVMAGAATVHQYHRVREEQGISPWVGLLVFGGIILFIVLASRRGGGGGGRGGGGGNGLWWFLLGNLLGGGGRGGGFGSGGGFGGNSGGGGGGSDGGFHDDGGGWGGGSSGGGESGSW